MGQPSSLVNREIPLPQNQADAPLTLPRKKEDSPQRICALAWFVIYI